MKPFTIWINRPAYWRDVAQAMTFVFIGCKRAGHDKQAALAELRGNRTDGCNAAFYNIKGGVSWVRIS